MEVLDKNKSEFNPPNEGNQLNIKLIIPWSGIYSDLRVEYSEVQTPDE